MTVSLFVREAGDPPPDLTAFEGAISAHWSEAAARLLVYAPSDWPGGAGYCAHPLEPLMAIAGASHGDPAPFHYIVWTDVSEGWDDELNAWYRDEHLPGLASVAGAVRARRFVQRGDGPRYMACYDLLTAETLGSPSWLAVRATEWSGRVRPEFRNTRRWMCRTLFDRRTDGAA
jgi:hypothetical protein